MTDVAHSDERTVQLDEIDAADIAHAAGVGIAFMAALPQVCVWWENDNKLSDMRKLVLAKLPDAPYPIEHGVLDVAHALNRLAVDDEIFYEFLARVDEQKEKVLAERAAREERMAARRGAQT